MSRIGPRFVGVGATSADPGERAATHSRRPRRPLPINAAVKLPCVSSLSQPDQDELVVLLEACSELSDPQVWAAVVQRLPCGIRRTVKHSPGTRAFLSALVRTCASREDGLAKLCAAVRWYEGEDSFAMGALDEFFTKHGLSTEAGGRDEG